MGVFRRFERGLEGLVTGPFARVFRSAVQPVEIASALQRELDNSAQVLSRDASLVPNDFTIELSPSDHERLAPYSQALSQELVDVVNRHAAAQHYTFTGPVTVSFERRDDLSTGRFRIRGSAVASVTARRSNRPDWADWGMPPGQPHQQPAQGYQPPPGPGYGPHPGPPGPYGPDQGRSPEADPARHGQPGAPDQRGPGPDPVGGSGPPPPPPWAPGPGGPGPVPRPGGEPRPDHWPEQRHGAEPAGQGPYHELRHDPGPPPYPGAGQAGPGSGPGGYPPAPPPTPQLPYLEVNGQRHPLEPPGLVLGRGTEADLRITDPGVSRRHAEIRVVQEGNGYTVTIHDLGSTNGIVVNGQRVDYAALHDGSQILLGNTMLVLRRPGGVR